MFPNLYNLFLYSAELKIKFLINVPGTMQVKWPKNILVTNILQIIIIFFIMHETLVMHVCLPIFKVAFSMYRNHNCWKHVTCSWMLHFRQCCPRLLLVVMMAAKFKVALLLMILATEEYFTAALMWHLNLFWFWVRVYCFIYSSHPRTPFPQWHEL